jgi:hypothetical protein
MMPAELVTSAIAVTANTLPQLSYFHDQLVARHAVNVFVHVLAMLEGPLTAAAAHDQYRGRSAVSARSPRVDRAVSTGLTPISLADSDYSGRTAAAACVPQCTDHEGAVVGPCRRERAQVGGVLDKPPAALQPADVRVVGIGELVMRVTTFRDSPSDEA